VIDRETFDRIKQKHGGYASWAVWSKPTGGPKLGMGDLSVLDPDLNLTLLETLRNDVVMLGLNLSRFAPEAPFRNFHDGRPEGQDYKTRYAFAGTPYYGAYMTDLIKGVVMLESNNVLRYLAEHPAEIGENIRGLLEEFDDLSDRAPLVIAFGGDAYRLADRYLPSHRYSRLVRVTHYSHFISKEDYRFRVLAELGA
jgi:hypothetical protein